MIYISDMKSKQELETEYETLASQIELLEKRLVPTKEKLSAYKLKDYYSISDDCLKNITRFYTRVQK